MKRQKRDRRKDQAYRSFRLWLCVCMFIILFVSLAVFSSVSVVVEKTEIIPGLNEDNWLPFVFSAVASLVIGTLLTPLILRIPLKPINRLISGMRRLAAGRYDERIDLGDLSIMKNLAESFNTMAEELENTELLRKDFVNNFSHEFKTPIVSIRGFARILQRGDLTPEKQKAYIDIIVDESTRLSSMATNVLMLTRVENQTILSDTAEFNLSEQLRRCILLLEKKWSEKQIELDADFGEYHITASQELLGQVWLNLLDNAVKFAPEGGKIRVRIHQRMLPGKAGSFIEVFVANNGPQIPPEQQERIFEKFYQGDTSHASEGTGIGLSVVRRVIELHQGTIVLESSPAETVFRVTIPTQRKM